MLDPSEQPAHSSIGAGSGTAGSLGPVYFPLVNGLAFDSATQTIFVADRASGRIYRYATNGALKGTFDRNIYNNSVLTDGEISSNGDRNFNQWAGILRSVSAMTAYEKSRVELDRVTGLTLTHNGIEIAEAERGQVQHMPNMQGAVPRENQSEKK